MKVKKLIFFIIVLFCLAVSSCSPRIHYSTNRASIPEIQYTVDSLVAYQPIGNYTTWPSMIVLGMSGTDSATLFTYTRSTYLPNGTEIIITINYSDRDSIAIIKTKEFR